MTERTILALVEVVRALRARLDAEEARRTRAWPRRLARGVRSSVRSRTGRALMAAGLLGTPLVLYAVTVPYVFVNGTAADAGEVNANFSALADALNVHVPDPSAHHAKTVSASELTTGVLSSSLLPSGVSVLGARIEESELGFDPATQSELDAHEGSPYAHHVKTLSASELVAGTLDKARLPASVSLLGPAVDLSELAFDPATQGELVTHTATADAHHARYSDAEAVAAVGPVARLPNRVLVRASGGDYRTIGAAIAALEPSESEPWIIDIAPGTYAEDLEPKSHLTLRGAPGGGTIIVPDNTGKAHVLLEGRTGVILRDLELRGDPATVNAYNAIEARAADVVLEGVTVNGYRETQVFAYEGSSVLLERVHLVDDGGNDNGLWLQDSTGVVLHSEIDTDGCAITASGSELRVSDSRVGRFEVCLDEGAGGGRITLSASELPRITASGDLELALTGNAISGASFGVYLDVASARLSGNRIRATGGAGIPVEVAGGDRNLIVGNVLEAWSSAPALHNAGTVHVVGNLIEAGGTVAVDDDGTAFVTQNRIEGGTIQTSSTTFAAFNEVPSGPTPEAWHNEGPVTVSSTGDALTLSAGGSSIVLSADGDVRIDAARDLLLTAARDAKLEAALRAELTTAGVLRLQGGPQIDADAAIINLN